jgi:hypothetical protein
MSWLSVLLVEETGGPGKNQRPVATQSLPPVGICLIYVICVCLRIEVSNTYCGVLVFAVFVFILLVYHMLLVSLIYTMLNIMRIILELRFYTIV